MINCAEIVDDTFDDCDMWGKTEEQLFLSRLGQQELSVNSLMEMDVIVG